MKEEHQRGQQFLRSAFTEAELDFLRRDPGFAGAESAMKTTEDFQNICNLGQRILSRNPEAVPAEKKLWRQER